jgi:hypothetical protein
MTFRSEQNVEASYEAGITVNDLRSQKVRGITINRSLIRYIKIEATRTRSSRRTQDVRQVHKGVRLLNPITGLLVG